MYNEFLFEKLGPTSLRSFELESPIPDLKNLDEDFNLISQIMNSHPELPIYDTYHSVPNCVFKLEQE